MNSNTQQKKKEKKQRDNEHILTMSSPSSLFFRIIIIILGSVFFTYCCCSLHFFKFITHFLSVHKHYYLYFVTWVINFCWSFLGTLKIWVIIRKICRTEDIKKYVPPRRYFLLHISIIFSVCFVEIKIGKK